MQAVLQTLADICTEGLPDMRMQMAECGSDRADLRPEQVCVSPAASRIGETASTGQDGPSAAQAQSEPEKALMAPSRQVAGRPDRRQDRRPAPGPPVRTSMHSARPVKRAALLTRLRATLRRPKLTAVPAPRAGPVAPSARDQGDTSERCHDKSGGQIRHLCSEAKRMPREEAPGSSAASESGASPSWRTQQWGDSRSSLSGDVLGSAEAERESEASPACIHQSSAGFPAASSMAGRPGTSGSARPRDQQSADSSRICGVRDGMAQGLDVRGIGRTYQPLEDNSSPVMSTQQQQKPPSKPRHKRPAKPCSQTGSTGTQSSARLASQSTYQTFRSHASTHAIGINPAESLRARVHPYENPQHLCGGLELNVLFGMQRRQCRVSIRLSGNTGGRRSLRQRRETEGRQNLEHPIGALAVTLPSDRHKLSFRCSLLSEISAIVSSCFYSQLVSHATSALLCMAVAGPRALSQASLPQLLRGLHHWPAMQAGGNDRAQAAHHRRSRPDRLSAILIRLVRLQQRL